MKELIGAYSARLRKMMAEKKPDCAHGGAGWNCHHPELQFSPLFRRFLRAFFPNRGSRPRCVLDIVQGNDGLPRCLYQEIQR